MFSAVGSFRLEMVTVKNALGAIVLLLWTIASVYVGAASFLHSKALENVSRSTTRQGSYDYQGLNFRNAEELRAFIRQEQLSETFPWAVDVPFELVPLLLAVSAGCLGGVVRVLQAGTIGQAPIWRQKFIGRPLFGVAIGLMLFLLATILPAILTSGGSAYRTESVLALSFFGGLFSERTFTWVEEQTQQVFKKASSGDKR
jgi:hypothetical protein